MLDAALGEQSGGVTIGSQGFTESRILAEMYRQLLEAGGVEASIKTVMNRELLEPALSKGDVALAPDYAATLAEFLNRKENGPDAPPVASPDLDTTMAALTALAASQNLALGVPTLAVDQNAFAVTREFAAEHNLETLSDLGASGIEVRIAAGEECNVRPFCAPGLEQTYGIKVSGVDPLGVGTAAAKQAVQDGRDDMVLVTTTDATLESYGLVLLADDKKLQNADNIVPVAYRGDAAQVLPIVDRLAPVLTTEDLAGLNRKVDQQRRRPATVVHDYLTEKGLI
ncbi:ABC transporter substrate-binding protein [Yinghuangia sp. KLBMP8922]|uniref:ABC transporter substrate-binding protein n=1 Tax=Yinghuangia soli TaxID=2908204 RepID=A0AA41U342_9ACTN|nr:ABC transporter substrate-binding protein [Yinghuangia soli]MCF2529322.1 ABC transporter substrate-binding protein [Yinghuangia soli]